MAQIYNTDLLKELKDGGKIQQIYDAIPSQLAEKVVPVMEVNPKMMRRCNIIRSAAATNATSATIYTAPTDKDFYLVAAGLSLIKDATSTSTFSRIQIQPDGDSNRNICQIPGITLTAQTQTVAVSFPDAIKVAKGTAISVNSDTNVANIGAAAWIVGYTIDNINA